MKEEREGGREREREREEGGGSAVVLKPFQWTPEIADIFALNWRGVLISYLW